MYDTNRPAFLESDLVGLSVDSNWSGFDSVVVNRCPFIRSERELWVDIKKYIYIY